MAQQALFDELAIQKVRVERLLLDSENPRLVTQAVEPSQNELLENLYKYSLGELMESIAERGYFSEEPLVGVPSGQTTEDGEEIFTIVEGNRRLAALRLLLFEEDRKLVDAKNVPAVGITELDRIREVPVKVYRTRKEVVPYLGVRHIVGVKPWDALAKARSDVSW